MDEKIGIALDKFERLINEQLIRIKKMKSEKNFIDYTQLDKIVIGVVGGDGIGPTITNEARRIMKFLLDSEIKKGKIEVRTIEGLTIEKRAEANKAIPLYVLEELKKCNVILKGPTTTPRQGDPWPNVESANVAMRKELDLFANVRPVRIPDQDIDWTFFRENIEGAYALGSKGIDIDEDLGIDFTVATKQGSSRIIKAAFEYARKNGKKRVTAVTKANVIKTTDGNFLNIFKEIAAQYPEIDADDWYIDIMTAKLIDKKRRNQFQVLVLPNLYGDILTDEAAEMQGGVGTAGSANIGKTYSMFEAIHGSAPRMVDEGRDIYADPSSIIKAAGMLIEHIGYTAEAKKLQTAIDDCIIEGKIAMTGRDTGATGSQYADYIMEKINKG